MIYTPRDYQWPFLNYMMEGGKRAFLVWHRRAGKNMTAWQWMYSEALINPGLYYYVFPSKTHGKKILWEGKTGSETDNVKFMDLIDPSLIWPNPRDGINHTDMTIKLRHPDDWTKEGSMIQIVGTKSDGNKNEADHLRGTNPRGVIMDEYSEHNPTVWKTIISPILLENQGWVVFTLTPKGPNHAFEMFNHVKESSRWFVQTLDVTQTKRANGNPVITEDAIQAERDEGVDEAYIQQEYYVSWAGVSKGAYYSSQIDLMYKQQRFTTDLFRPELDCFTTWDIGHEDATVVLIGQTLHGKTVFLDGFKEFHKDLKWCWMTLQEMAKAYGYRYAVHYMPWDFVVHEWGASQSRETSAMQLGMRNLKTAPKLKEGPGIDAVRKDFPYWYISSEKLGWAISDLGLYSRDDPPKTDHKHTADAFRTYATSSKMPSHDVVANLPTSVDAIHDIFQETPYAHQRRTPNDLRRLHQGPTQPTPKWPSQYTSILG